MSTQPIDVQMTDLPQAARLHMARYLAGLEITELSRRTGISRGTIANYERLDYSKRRTPAYIRLWAMATGVDYQWLSDGVPYSPDGARVLDRGYRHSVWGIRSGPFSASTGEPLETAA